MKKIFFSSLFLLSFILTIDAAIISVSNQTEYDAMVTSPIMASDTVKIEEGATIINTGALDIFGTIINCGDFTMNGTGVAVNMMGKIINTGVFTIGNVGLSIVDGTFENAGILNVNGAAIVIQTNGSLFNTGTINNSVDIANMGVYGECGTVNGTPVRDAGGTFDNSVPVNTVCNDNNDDTENDVIIDDACTCMGEEIVPIPTLSQWSLILLILLFGIIGSLYLRTKPSLVKSN